MPVAPRAARHGDPIARIFRNVRTGAAFNPDPKED